MHYQMKRKYIKPTSVELQLSSEGFMCMSFGGEGDGRPAQSNQQDFKDSFSWDTSGEEETAD